MRVYISNYRHHWISPYTMLDWMFFWTDWSKCNRDKSLQRAIDAMDGRDRFIERPEWCDRWSDRLEPVSRAIQWVLDRVHPKVDYVKIDRWDTWSMDHTLGLIALPMLRQLRAAKHGSPLVEDEDVPEHLRSTAAPARENDWDIDDNHHKRWDWVMNEMIFAFEHHLNDAWQDQYRSGEIDHMMTPVDVDGNEVPEGQHKYYRMDHGPNHTYQCDYDAIEQVQKRIANGFRLFGKYYANLWD